VPIKLEAGFAGTAWNVALRTYAATAGLNANFSHGPHFSELSGRGK
jgi:hypothetical protein